MQQQVVLEAKQSRASGVEVVTDSTHRLLACLTSHNATHTHNTHPAQRTNTPGTRRCSAHSRPRSCSWAAQHLGGQGRAPAAQSQPHAAPDCCAQSCEPVGWGVWVWVVMCGALVCASDGVGERFQLHNTNITALWLAPHFQRPLPSSPTQVTTTTTHKPKNQPTCISSVAVGSSKLLPFCTASSVSLQL